MSVPAEESRAASVTVSGAGRDFESALVIGRARIQINNWISGTRYPRSALSYRVRGQRATATDVPLARTDTTQLSSVHRCTH